MLNDLTFEQRKLADFISDISERCYSASWLENLEYVLWDMLNKGERKYGRDVLTQQDIKQLIQLSNDCKCWIYFDDIKEETAIDIELWKEEFDKTIFQNPNILKG
ncbi:MAG: hypothetical protein ABJB05_11815 [Parafilimonas sp.]